ncbi:glycosyltransferase [Pelagibacteraceae bacterium]|nr:glycosyltransferase [Pelagibacteraceae bacterium]
MFSIVIPIFNEARNIAFLLKEISRSLENFKNYEIILVNDASTDDSIEVINNINNQNIKIIINDNNKGQSFSIYEGVKNSSYETIITIDGDGQNDPADIPKLYNFYIQSNEIKLVGGIRKNRKDSLNKIISSKIANYIRSKILKDGCKDTGCSLKVFNKKIFLSFPFFNGVHRFLPALFRGYGYKTVFLEVNHRKRIYGSSKYGTMNRLFAGIRDIIKVKKILKK